MKLIKIIAVLIILYNVFVWAFDKFKQEEWMGFVYPNANNLTNDRYVGTFNSLTECRDASLSMLKGLGALNRGDYECALNCDTSGGKPYICEETSR